MTQALALYQPKFIACDTEFNGCTRDTFLISAAFVTDRGDQFYGVINDNPIGQITEWVREHVMSTLEAPEPQGENDTHVIGTRDAVRDQLLDWLSQFNWPTDGKYTTPLIIHRPFYDWPLLDEMLAERNPWTYRDVIDFHSFVYGMSQKRVSMSDRPSANKHNALDDAAALKDAYLSLSV